MDKQVDGLAGAMREIAGLRDNQLRDAGGIPPDRLKQLQALLAAELPVEAGLFAATRQRDELLSAADPVLPTAVHAALAEQVRSVRPLDMLRQFGAYRAAAALAVAALIGATLLHFSHARNWPTQISSEARPGFVANSEPGVLSGVDLFDRSIDPLTLRMNRLELASLDPSLLTINRALFDFEPSNHVLPLDLPIRQIHLDVETIRTP
ncbi:MAG: hypothetical protein ACJ8NS_14480 [Chthoniobacterales bacterium]|jgi:hypothetical protein